MPDEQTEKGPSFAQREPVVTAAASVPTSVALAFAVMDVIEAFEWHQFTTTQTRAVAGIVLLLTSIGGGVIASRKVTPQAKVDELVTAALLTPVPVIEDDFTEGAKIAGELAAAAGTSGWQPPPWPTEG